MYDALGLIPSEEESRNGATHLHPLDSGGGDRRIRSSRLHSVFEVNLGYRKPSLKRGAVRERVACRLRGRANGADRDSEPQYYLMKRI